MATVWELIQEHSIAPPGSTFWEHLNAQEGGGSSGTFLVSSLDVEQINTDVEVELIDDTIHTEILE